MIEVRVVVCDCGCNGAKLNVFVDGKPVLFRADVINGYVGGLEANEFHEWLKEYKAPMPDLFCGHCQTHYLLTDSFEQTSLNDHGRCVACQKKWTMGELRDE